MYMLIKLTKINELTYDGLSLLLLNSVISKRLSSIREFLDSERKSWTLHSGRWTLDAELWTLEAGLWTLDAKS